MPVTNKFGWTMPTVGVHKNAWGQILNNMFDDMDQSIQRLTAIGSIAPTEPTDGDLWVDTTGGGEVLKVWSSTVWVTISAGSGANQLSELSDVGVSTPASGNVLSADGVDFDSKTPDTAGLVAKTGAQTIGGVKTFSYTPVIPVAAPTADAEVANKKYVDDNAGGFNEYTGSKNNMTQDQEITIAHPLETAYDPRIVNFVREVLGSDVNWSSLDFDTGDEASFLQGDVKGTIAQLKCDTVDVSGHFETSGSVAVSIGSGNTEDRVQVGCRFKIGSDWYEITAVTGDGSGADGVVFTLQDGSAATLATGIHAVSEIVGTEFVDNKAKLNQAGSGSYGADICTGGSASASSIINATYPASDAFNDTSVDDTDAWISLTTPTQWLKYDLGAGNEKTPRRYRIRARNRANQRYTPKDFKLQGSNNDSDWTDLDSQTGIADPGQDLWIGWYEFSNGTAYRYLRLNVTDSNEGAVYVCVGELEISEMDVAYPVDQFHIGSTTDSNQANTTDWVNLVSAEITELLNSQLIYYAFSFDGRTTWGIWDGTGGDDGWRPIVRFSTVWQFNSNVTAGATDVTWTNASTSGENSQESAFEQAFQVVANQMTATEANAITDAQWNDQTGGMTGWSTSVTSLNFAWGMKTTSSAATPELDAVVITYTAPTKWEPIVPDSDWVIEMYATSTKLIKIGAEIESVVKGRVRIPK